MSYPAARGIRRALACPKGEAITAARLTDWRKLAQGLHARYLVDDFGTGARFVTEHVAVSVIELGLDTAHSATIAPVWAALLTGNPEAQGHGSPSDETRDATGRVPMPPSNESPPPSPTRTATHGRRMRRLVPAATDGANPVTTRGVDDRAGLNGRSG